MSSLIIENAECSESSRLIFYNCYFLWYFIIIIASWKKNFPIITWPSPFAYLSGFGAALNIQSDQILVRLPCCAKGKWGSNSFPSTNEKLQSTHGCHFLSCLLQQIRDTGRVWMIRSVHFHVKKIKIIQLGPKLIVIQLLSIWMSLQKQSVND